MTLLAAHVICAALTWVALVADGTTHLTPRRFVRALRHDVETFGAIQVWIWVALCLVCWWAVWFAWMAENWLEPPE